MIFNSDKEDEGYLEGLRQARAGERKEYRTTGLVKAAISPFDHSFKSYMKGIDRGFADGLQETHTERKVTLGESQAHSPGGKSTTTTNTMNDSIGAQLESLENLKNFMAEFADTLNDAAEQYRRHVQAVGEQGMVERVVQRYEDEFMTPNLNQIRTLIDTIRSEDVPYIARETEHLEQLGHQ